MRKKKRGKLSKGFSEKDKKLIKERFDKINPDNLNKEQRNYYNKIKGGKARAESSLRFKGKYVSKELKELAEGVANIKGISVETLFSNEKNIETFDRFIKKGSLAIERTQDKIFDELSEMDSRKKVYVKDGEDTFSIPAGDMLVLFLDFNQIAKSGMAIVDLRFVVDVYPDGKTVYNIPNFKKFKEAIEEGNPDKVQDYLDENEIFYIVSDKPAKGKK